MRTKHLPISKAGLVTLGILSFSLAFCSTTPPNSSSGSKGTSPGWKTCRDDRYGFSLRYPPDWQSTTPEGRCVQLQKGKSTLPEGIPEVDVFIRVSTLRGNFPADYLKEEAGGNVTYTSRKELSINGLPAVEARFQSAGPTPNWGVEYAISKGDQVLDIYISQPKQDVEALFEQVVRTIQW